MTSAAFASLDGWADVVKPRETFAKGIHAKMEVLV